MASLIETLSVDGKRPVLVRACCDLIDDEVARKSGLKGLAVKGGFKAIKAIKPGFIADVVDNLFDEFVAQLEPYFEAWCLESSGSFGQHLLARDREVADSLLEVTDGRARTTKMATVKKLYHRLRPAAEGHVREALPGMASIMDTHVTRA